MAEKITVQYVRNLGETLGELIAQSHMLASFNTESAKHGAQVYAAVAMEKMHKMKIAHAHNHRLCASFVTIEDENDGFLIRFMERCDRLDKPYTC